VRAVQFDAIETGFDRAGRCVAEILDDPGNLIQTERPRDRRVDKALPGDECLGVRTQRRRPHRRCVPFLKAGVRDATGMPKLDDDHAAHRMDGIGDDSPPRNLGGCVAAWCVRIALRLSRHLCRLGDDKAG